MYAVIETGGKQYRVEVGTELEVELLEADSGSTITLDRVLLVADGDDATIGRPVVENAAVSAEILRRIRGEKLISFKYRPKARRRVKKGHRQELTVLRISDITLDGKSAAKAATKAADDAKTERQRLEEAAAKQASVDAALAAKLAVGAAPSDGPGKEAPKGRGKKAAADAPTTTGTDVEDAPAKPARAKASKASTAKARGGTAKAAPKKSTRTASGEAGAPTAKADADAPKRRTTKKGE